MNLALFFFMVGLASLMASLAFAVSDVTHRKEPSTVASVTEPVPGFFDRAGRPFANGRVYIYEAGSTWKAVSYRTPELRDDFGLVNTNPVELDANGRANIYLRPGAYDVTIDSVVLRINVPVQ